MAAKTIKLTDEERIYSQLSEYLEDELSPADRAAFDEFVKGKKLDSLTTDYGIARGKLQIEAQRLFLDEARLHSIHQLVEDDAARANHEAQDIDAFSKTEVRNQAVRFTLLLLVLGAAVVFGIKFFSAEKKAPFKALDSLIYEAIVMSEDAEERLDFPTDSMADLNNYFKRYPDLGFTPKVLQGPGQGWELNGATVIDYEVAKILAVKMKATSSDEHLYLFLFEGALSSLPPSTPGNHQGLMYQAYASDKLNVIAWQASPEMTGMMIGYRGAKDLAEIAFRMVGL